MWTSPYSATVGGPASALPSAYTNRARDVGPGSGITNSWYRTHPSPVPKSGSGAHWLRFTSRRQTRGRAPDTCRTRRSRRMAPRFQLTPRILHALSWSALRRSTAWPVGPSLAEALRRLAPFGLGFLQSTTPDQDDSPC